MLLNDITKIIRVLLGAFEEVASQDALTQRRIGQIGRIDQPVLELGIAIPAKPVQFSANQALNIKHANLEFLITTRINDGMI